MIIRKDVVSLTVPVIAEQAFVVLMGIVNTIMAGRLGEEAVAAIGMVDSANNIFIAFFSALAVGGTVVVAHYSGRENFSSANEATKHTLYSGFLLSFVITVVFFIFRHDVLQLLFGAAEKAVMDSALIYLEITLPTYPLIALTSIACRDVDKSEYGTGDGVGSYGRSTHTYNKYLGNKLTTIEEQ